MTAICETAGVTPIPSASHLNLAHRLHPAQGIDWHTVSKVAIRVSGYNTFFEKQAYSLVALVMPVTCNL